MDPAVSDAAEKLGLLVGQSFGPRVLAARLEGFAQMQARNMAVTNLLTKAVRRLGDGDVRGADALIARVIAMAEPDGELPWDEAQMMLHNAVCDVMEEAPEDDSAWLDRALQVMPELEGLALLSMEQVLTVLLRDYNISPEERRRISSAVQTVDPGAVVDRLMEDGTVGVADAMREILTVAWLYQKTE